MSWIKLCLILIIVFVLISIVKLFLRNLLQIEKVKKEFFSFNYINKSHRKIDKGLRIFSAVTLITLSYVLLFYYEDLISLLLIPLIVFMVLDYIVIAFFEWKYTEHPKQSILTISEMFLILIAVIVVFEFKLLVPY